MIRRTARLRREFVYRKSLEGKERELYEKKRKIRQCLEEGKVIPTELRNAEASLRSEIALEDASTAANGASADDEYARANERDPKVLVTTSRDPSSRLTQFVKEVKLLMPTARRINRGAQVLPDLVELCRSNDFTDLVVVHEHRGEPDGLVVSHMPFGPTAYFGLSNAVMRHDVKDQDIGTVSEANPHLILENFTTPLGKRTANILKHLFPAPKDGKSKRVITFANDADYVSMRHHTYEMPRGAKSVALTEIELFGYEQAIDGQCQLRCRRHSHRRRDRRRRPDGPAVRHGLQDLPRHRDRRLRRGDHGLRRRRGDDRRHERRPRHYWRGAGRP